MEVQTYIKISIFVLDMVLVLMYMMMLCGGWFISTSALGDSFFFFTFLTISITALTMALLTDLKGHKDLVVPTLIVTILKLVIVIIFYFIFGIMKWAGAEPIYHRWYSSSDLPNFFIIYVVLHVLEIIGISATLYFISEEIEDQDVTEGYKC